MAGKHIEYGLWYNKESAEYLQKVNYRDLVQWLMSETLVGVAKARAGEESATLELLDRPWELLLELVKSRINQRDENGSTTSEDLQAVGKKRDEVLEEGGKVKWVRSRPVSPMRSSGANSRPITSHSSRPMTAQQTPMDIELRTLKNERTTNKDVLDAVQLKVHIMTERLRMLKTRQSERAAAAGAMSRQPAT